MAFGADRTVKVNLKATVSDYVGKMSAASKATKDFGRDAVQHAQKHREAWDKVGKGMTLTGAAIGLAVVGAVKAFADFDEQMSQVRAVSGASAADMAKLTAAAREAGAGTKFSATEAAQATTELAKVGLSTADILGGALTGSLNLAAAGNLDLADAAEISGQTMKIFGLQGKDVSRIADALANGANKSAADVGTLSQALKQGGLVAAQTGLNMEDTVGVLSLFADNALQGSDAGTSFKTMLQRLNPQSDEAAAAMQELGINAYDAQGAFIGIEALAGQLHSALSGLSAAERNAALQTIFGADAIRAATVLYKAGSSGVHEYVEAVKESGSAARVAAINQDNLKGDIEKLTGAISDLAIGAGEAGNGPLRDFVRSLTSMVDTVGSLPKPVQSALFYVAAFTSAALLAGGAIITLVPRIAATKAALDTLGVSAGRASVALKGLGAAAAVVGVAVAAVEISKLAPGAQAATVSSDKLAQSLLDVANNAKKAGELGRLFDGHGLFGDKVKTSAEALDKFAESAQIALGQNLTDKIDRLGDFGNGAEKFGKQVDQIDSALAKLVQNGNADEASAAYDRLMKSIEKANKEGANIPVDEVAAKFKNYQAAIDAASQSQDAAATSAAAAGNNLDRLYESAEQAAAAVTDYVKSLQDASQAVLDTRSAQRALEAALDDVDASIKENGKSLDIHTKKGRANQEALDKVADSILKVADNTYKDTLAKGDANKAEDAYRASLVKSRASLVQTAQKFGLTKKQAEAYADSILKIPAARTTTATFKTVGLSGLKAAGEYLKDLHDKKVTLTVGTVRVGNSKVNAGQFADGGYIAGPGTGTSDSIPAYLSNGEYVVKAAAVERYGRSFFDSVNAMRFASGGFVSRSQSAAAAAAPAPNVTFNAYGQDADAAAKRAMREWEYRQVSRL